MAKKNLHKFMLEKERVALEKSKQVTELQKNFAQTNAQLEPADSDMSDKKDDNLVEANQLIDEANQLIEKRDYLEERSLDQMQSLLEMQQRLDAVNAGVTVKVRIPPREPEAIMLEARQLNNRLAELKTEFAQWQATHKETAH